MVNEASIYPTKQLEKQLGEKDGDLRWLYLWERMKKERGVANEVISFQSFSQANLRVTVKRAVMRLQSFTKYLSWP